MKERTIRNAFLGPLIVLMTGILGYPLASDLWLSLHDVRLSNYRSGPEWVGLANYARVLTDGGFWHSIFFSAQFAVVATAIELLLGLAIALFFWKQFRSSRPVISLMLMPMMTAPALLAIMFRLMLNDFVGTVPLMMQSLGLPSVLFLGPQWVRATLVAIDAIQWTPFVFLLVYTGLQGIPEEILEASAVDGAATHKTLRYIVLPQIGAVLGATAFLRFIDTFRIFDSIYVLTGGGPGELTTSSSIYIYKQAFGNGHLGLGIAGAVVLLLIILAPVGWATRRFTSTGGKGL